MWVWTIEPVYRYGPEATVGSGRIFKSFRFFSHSQIVGGVSLLLLGSVIDTVWNNPLKMQLQGCKRI
jgi:hypothetical protein